MSDALKIKVNTVFSVYIVFTLIFNASDIMPERIYNPITAMGFSAMFTFQLDNTKR